MSTEPPFYPGDVVECTTREYNTILYGELINVKGVHPDGRGGWVLRTDVAGYSGSTFKAKNFRLYKAYRQGSEWPQAQPQLKDILSHNQGANIEAEYKVPYIALILCDPEVTSTWGNVHIKSAKSPQEAHEVVRALLKEHPENKYGIFTLDAIGRLREPPVTYDLFK
jgi:hypothetical protein